MAGFGSGAGTINSPIFSGATEAAVNPIAGDAFYAL